MDTFHRPTWVEVSLDAVHHNVSSFRALLPPEIRLMAIVKADAYGHGAVEVLREAEQAGATYAGVAFLDEAIELRRAGVRLPILVLGFTPPEAAAVALEHKVTLTVFSQEWLEAALAAGQPTAARPLKLHVKLDTGMGRLGFTEAEEAIAFIDRALAMEQVNVEGLYTHFASADEQDKTYTQMQHARFDRIVRHYAEQGITFPLVHTGNSATAIDCPELTYNMVRLGISMYGLYPSEEVHQERLELQPVMSFHTKPVMIKRVPPGTGISYGVTYRTQREAIIATLPVGYADGYSRMLSGRVEALVQGRRVPVVGRICMDQCMMDVTELPQVTLEDEVVLFGRQGTERIAVEELAQRLGTVNYELVCMITHRVPRVYIKNGQRVKVTNPLLKSHVSTEISSSSLS